MGKTNNRRSAFGHHARQVAQMDMIVHGWVATLGKGARHDEHGCVFKYEGKFQWSKRNAMRVGVDVPCEWDELSTLRVLWLYKALKREKLL